MEFAYRAAIGELIYSYIICIPDIVYTVIKLASFSNRPAACHYRAFKRVFRYIRQTKDWRLVYWRRNDRMDLSPGNETLKEVDELLPPFLYPSDPFELGGIVDASHVNDLKTSRSTTWLCMIFDRIAVMWQAKKQRTVAESSTEAEFIEVVHVAKIVKYIRYILLELWYRQASSTIVYEDSPAAILMANTDKHTIRTHHIDIQLFAL